MSEITNEQVATETKIKPEDINLPPHSYWPLIVGLGLALIFGGLAIDLSMAGMGVFMALVGIIGWIVVPVNPKESAK